MLLADEAYRIGPAPSSESYLRMAAIVELAVEIGADAIHPGYGFLSERAEFSALCRERGIVFIGPPPEAIDAMGSKVEARRRMIAAGVPVVPGSDGPLADVDEALAVGAPDRLPVMLKASAGGGGKGMRVVRAEAELAEAYRLARAEAGASFGDDSRLPREVRRAAAPHRDPGARRPARPGGLAGRARVLAPAPAPEGGRGVALAGGRPRAAPPDGRGRGGGGRGGRLHQRRHLSSSCSPPTASSTSSR